MPCSVALVVSYAYHPNSQTLADLYLKNPASSSASTPTAGTPPPIISGGRFKVKPNQGQIGAFNQPRYSHRVPERTLWSYVVQIANATKAVHDAGMAVRVLDASKILVTGKNR
jgi:PAB-dependent poly(A)-specific ribonuclease subunit 3